MLASLQVLSPICVRAVFGRITNKVKMVEGLQIGQLIKFHKDCIADVADDDDDSDSD